MWQGMPTHRLVATVKGTARTKLGETRQLSLIHGRTVVPGIWMVPAGARDVPAALLLHGLTSSKEQMAQSVGRALMARGVASLSLDLPLHGERGTGDADFPRNPLALVSHWRDATTEARAAVRWLAEEPEVDAGRLGIVGYSLGGFLAITIAAEEESLGAVVLAAAGDLPDAVPYATMVRSVVDPLRAARHLDGRPLLLVNGRRDRTTKPAQAERLFEAAAEPKEIQWYEGGHWPPQAAINRAAEWLAERI